MKNLLVISLTAAIATLAGCSTPKRVASMQGSGTKRVYAAAFDPVWRSTVDAVQHDGLQIISADRQTGYIDARRTVRLHTFGENVGIWVSPVAPDSTAVEVVSRQAGPPVAWLKNWENEIHQSIAANLSREVPAVGAAPRETYIDPNANGGRDRVRENIIPDPLRDEQLRYDELRTKHEAGERALANEVDETKRAMLQKEVDRLREDIRLQEERLRDLERELK
jgi:hypothetical protein